MEPTDGLGSLLRELRTARNITQAAAAEAAGLARTTLNRWEGGSHQPRLPELNAVLDVLSATPSVRTHALSLIAAPRAIKVLRSDGESQPAPDDSWAFTPETGDLLRAMRLRRHLTQEEVAVALGVRRHTLSRWEGGELLPSAERLTQLTGFLNARPEETAALTRGALWSPRQTADEDALLEELSRRYDQITQGAYDARMEPLKDLEYLRLERELAKLAPRHLTARHRLFYTYSWHALWLATNGRYREATQYADRVIEAAHRETMPATDWQRVILVAARCSVYGGKRLRPDRGVEVLQNWLPLITEPTYEGWVLGDISLYLAQSGQLESALNLAVRACRVAQRCENPAELRYRRVDRVEILLQTGRPQDAQQALDLLPINPAYDPVERAREATLWAKALDTVGDIDEAQQWLGRAQEIAQTHHLDPNSVTELATRL